LVGKTLCSTVRICEPVARRRVEEATGRHRFQRTKKAHTGPGADLGSAQNAYIVRLSMELDFGSRAAHGSRAGDG
jgi:hypothetical protein